MSKPKPSDWLCLAVGNSRLHWAWFRGEQLQFTWHSPYLTRPIVNNTIPSEILPHDLLENNLARLPLCFASVVPAQTSLWETYGHLRQITLADIPLANIYPTMGIDRALAVWGAGKTYGFPCLVIDAGTALTFTGVNKQQELIGGAILPGLRLQLQSLSSQTAALPAVEFSESLPIRWALTTPEAIESGIVYTVLAGIQSFIIDWTHQFPQGKIIMTGGDSCLLAQYWQGYRQEVVTKIIVDPKLIFWGMKLVYSSS